MRSKNKMKNHYKLITITDWTSDDFKEHKKIVWFTCDEMRDFKIFDTDKQAQDFARTL